MYVRRSSAALTPSMSRSPVSILLMICTSVTQSSSAGGGVQPLCAFQTLLPRLDTAENSARRTHLAGTCPSAKMYPF
eukprot:6724981-Alexandrium_andersonii.AAC.1